jgi:hypothetical protein
MTIQIGKMGICMENSSKGNLHFGIEKPHFAHIFSGHAMVILLSGSSNPFQQDFG